MMFSEIITRCCRAWLTSVLIACLGTAAFAANPAAPSAPRRYAAQSNGQPVDPKVIAKEVCAWPAMTKLPNGTLLITNFNRPSHGRMIGDVDCWASEDQGKTWTQRATAAPHETGTNTNRMNVAFGTLANGDALLASSGWSLKPDSASPTGFEIDRVLPIWLCRSRDAGRSWSIDRTGFPPDAPDGGLQIPFGPIYTGSSGVVLIPTYSVPLAGNPPKPTWNRVYVHRSTDGGKTWGGVVPLDADTRLNETALLHVEGGRWLAFARSDRLYQYESLDDGRTWSKNGPVTEKACYPSNPIRLSDGRLLLSYGNRTSGDPRVEALLSSDGGKSWSSPLRLIDLAKSADGKLEDMGYPSSIELPGGNVITAYYAKNATYYNGYHLGVVTWNLARSFGDRPASQKKSARKL